MIERGEGSGLLFEAAEAIRIRGEFPRQDLDGNIAGQSRVARAPDLTHCTRAQLREDFVRTDPMTRVHV
jgi:hypothetical protein